MNEERQTTKDRLLDAAESLFGAQGFQDVSIRELAAAAEVNVAAINYHFQNKENLVREVILRRFILHRDRTLGALERLMMSTAGSPRTDQVIQVLVGEHLAGSLDPHGMVGFLTLMSREMHDPRTNISDPFFKELVAPVFKAFSQALLATNSRLDQDNVSWVLASIIGQAHHFIMRRLKKRNLPADSESLPIMLKAFPPLGLPIEQYVEQVTEHITRFSTAAIDGLYPEVSA